MKNEEDSNKPDGEQEVTEAEDRQENGGDNQEQEAEEKASPHRQSTALELSSQTSDRHKQINCCSVG